MNVKAFLNTLALVIPFGAASAGVSQVYVSRDAAIYSEGSLANGAGEYLFAGVTGPNNGEAVRRSLLYFNLSSALPAGAVVTSATLRLNVDREPFGAGPVTAALHTASTAWSEGVGNPSGSEGTGMPAASLDVTWTEPLFGAVSWSTPGGDFDSAASASAELSGLGTVLFSSPGMAADVQLWYDNPSMNFGWFLLVDETGSQNARRFSSGEAGVDPNLAPLLTIGYEVVPEPASLLLVCAGVLTLGGRRLKRRIS